MKKLAIILAVALLASCAQSKDVAKQNQEPKSSQEKKVEKAEQTEQTKSPVDPSYSVFNNLKFDEFKKIFQEKYEETYKAMSNGGEVAKTPLTEVQENEMLYDIRLTQYLVLSCIENDNGTLGMAVVVKLTPAQDPNFDAVTVNKQFDILKQALIATTAPGAKADDLKAINAGLPQVPKPMDEDPSFTYKGIVYMDSLDTDEPGVTKESFMTTYE